MIYRISILLLLIVFAVPIGGDTPPTLHFEKYLTDPIVPLPEYRKRYVFHAYKNGKFMYEIDYALANVLYQSLPHYGIFTQITGTDVEEKNVVYLDTNAQVKFVFQSSENSLEDSHFKWEINNLDEPAVAKMVKTDSDDNTVETFQYPHNGYPVQAFMYLLDQYAEMGNWSDMRVKLLVPPAQFIGLYCKKLNVETISYNDQLVESAVVEIGVSGIFSFLLPKYRFWIGTQKPYIVYRYTFQDVDVHLVDAARLPVIGD